MTCFVSYYRNFRAFFLKKRTTSWLFLTKIYCILEFLDNSCLGECEGEGIFTENRWGEGGFFSNYQCRCSKKQSTVAINSPHNVKENWNFVFHSKNLLFCSYSRRNLTEKITLDFFFWFFFSHLSITTYLPIFLDNLPKSILLPEKK